jgi:transcriptional regulator with XRE-family HTH domain
MASKPRKPPSRETSKANCGRKIIALRLYLKINQAELGKRVGASAMLISRWEAGSRQPPANYLIKFGLLATPNDCWYFWGTGRINRRGRNMIIKKVRADEVPNGG